MVRAPSTSRETASQRASPFVPIGCLPGNSGLGGVYARDAGGAPAAEGAHGTPVTSTGAVLDGTGWALRAAPIETWQADAPSRYPGQPGADPAVTGFARVAFDGQTGRWTPRTIKPGPVPTCAGPPMAPRLALRIVARGINAGLLMRLCFPDEDNSAGPVLARIEQRPLRRYACRAPDGRGHLPLRHPPARRK